MQCCFPKRLYSDIQQYFNKVMINLIFSRDWLICSGLKWSGIASQNDRLPKYFLPYSCYSNLYGALNSTLIHQDHPVMYHTKYNFMLLFEYFKCCFFQYATSSSANLNHGCFYLTFFIDWLFIKNDCQVLIVIYGPSVHHQVINTQSDFEGDN